MKDKAYWKTLTERYFDAETSLKEEDELKAFAASTTDPDFDELRAVMGYLAVGRKQVSASRKATAPRIALYVRVAAAAIFLLIALPWGYRQLQPQEENICLAYVDGKKLTDSDAVMALMHQTMQSLEVDDPSMTVEGQLSDLFNTIE